MLAGSEGLVLLLELPDDVGEGSHLGSQTDGFLLKTDVVPQQISVPSNIRVPGLLLLLSRFSALTIRVLGPAATLPLLASAG